MVNSQTVGEIALAMYAPPFVYPLRGELIGNNRKKVGGKLWGFPFEAN